MFRLEVWDEGGGSTRRGGRASRYPLEQEAVRRRRPSSADRPGEPRTVASLGAWSGWRSSLRGTARGIPPFGLAFPAAWPGREVPSFRSIVPEPLISSVPDTVSSLKHALQEKMDADSGRGGGAHPKNGFASIALGVYKASRYIRTRMGRHGRSRANPLLLAISPEQPRHQIPNDGRGQPPSRTALLNGPSSHLQTEDETGPRPSPPGRAMSRADEGRIVLCPSSEFLPRSSRRGTIRMHRHISRRKRFSFDV